MRFLLVAFLCAWSANAQDYGRNILGTPNLPAQKIGPRDLIAIQVYDSPELTRTVRVGADGFIRLPMLKQLIQAEGLMPSDLETVVANALEEEGILVAPWVTITVAEYASRPVSIAGAVRNPLTFQASAPVTLLEAITRAGGLLPEAGSEILISKTDPASGDDQSPIVRRVAVKSLIDAADPLANLLLTGGEEIRVPEAGKIFVIGNVKHPGAFPVQDGAESSVLKVLAQAEGLSPFFAKQAFIYRRDLSGSKKEIPIELDQIMNRKAPDQPLFPNDILYVPDNRSRRIGLAALEKLLMFGSTAGATALVYGQLH